jgi:NAD(P)-dependent dehydrogenase (short-subunit alcohol dehydrogenase family)
MQVAGKVAAITGAATGLGRQVAYELARRGAALSLADLRGDALTETVEALRATGARADGHELDVSDREAVQDWAKAVDGEYGGAALLVNNAGISQPSRTVEELEYETLRQIFDVNLWGAVHTTQAFLPQLRRPPQAHIVNVASLSGVGTFPGQAGYCMSKFALCALSGSLQMELAGSGVGVLTVVPGGIRGTRILLNAPGYSSTEAARADARLQKMRFVTVTAEHAAGKIVRAVERDRARLRVGGDAVVVDLLARVLGGAYPRIFGPIARRMGDLTRTD